MGGLSLAVDAAIDAAPTDTRDVATQHLARVYAAMIDEAIEVGKWREPLDILHRALPDDPRVTAAYRRIEDTLALLNVVSDLGPKLLATLTQLGLTPAARGTAKGGPDAAPIASKLDELRERRRRRGPN